MTYHNRYALTHRALRAARYMASIASLAALVGCNFLDSLVDVDVPSQLVDTEYESPENALIIVNGAIGDFECAFAHYIVAAGMVGDELMKSSGGETWTNYDRRASAAAGGLPGSYAENTCDQSNSNQDAPGVYRTLQTARFQGDRAKELLEGWSDAEVPNRTSLIATAAAYGAYSALLLGEGMCSAAFDLGPELTRAEIFTRAEQRFTEAITAAQSSGDADILNMALVGRARARLNLGNASGAADDATLVPGGFVHNATYSTVSARRENYVYTANHLGAFVSIEGMYRDFRFQGALDPRVDVVDTGQNATASSPVRWWLEQKYLSHGSPIPIARWEEAQLIIAEAEVQAGNLQAAVDIINTLHGQVGLGPFSSTDPVAILDQIIMERRAELFLESHHLGDFQRYSFALVPPVGDPHPFGGVYGDQICFPLPDVERFNNPNID